MNECMPQCFRELNEEPVVFRWEDKWTKFTLFSY